MKFISFNDSKIDTNLFLQLQDLASILAEDEELEFEYQFGHFLDRKGHRITASHFWDNRNETEMVAGYKTDIYLRAVGSRKYTNETVLAEYKETLAETHLKKFAQQLFTLFEDIRIEELCKKERPGTKKLFRIRRETLKKYFRSQAVTNKTMSYFLDELFCLIFITVEANAAYQNIEEANEKQQTLLEEIKPLIFELYEAKSTVDVVRLCERIVFRLTPEYDKDSMNEYFVYPFYEQPSSNNESIFDELKRKDGLKNDDEKNVDSEQEGSDESFSTWHREIDPDEQNQTFLQFELESGTETDMLGDGAREGEEGDQAMASVQGASGKSKEKDYSSLEALQDEQSKKRANGSSKYGEENRDAIKIEKSLRRPSLEEIPMYQEIVTEIDGYRRKLSTTIEKTLEHKKISPRRDLLYGRLSKKLLPVTFEPVPRVFYKKNSPSTEIDAVFTLLVDCSASMHNKMVETKKGIALFHEVLKKLRIPHSVVGFWEDANEVKKGYQPNYFHRVVSFENSLHNRTGVEILQLQPEEDNRDGYSIRVISEELLHRREKHRFLLVFSDGEPAADGYDQNGIVDTHEAVLFARKQGIDVIGMFLANGEIEETDEKTMGNIYGKEYVLVPSVDRLSEQFAPLLKKLILKSL
ncbi:vWA domain-containing protein [Halalkalibacter urbisdiaboli]|uniref:vWA domain-containing protein n=1 Tax=Halalkalibacter urbisdiaboli TaxID=1960589 RepID=UPI000B43081E|nr:VWA domain-containing protein [Halalkalibacter urbisdiaboli]